jgi:hypothetical protein
MPTSSKQLLVVFLASALAACGGSSPGTGTGPATSTANLFLQGAITARQAGQIEVAGVTVTTPPTVHIEGVERPETELKTGMVVKVRAHGSGRHAEGLEVEFEDAAKGTVQSASADGVVVSGQAVHVDDATEFDDQARGLGSLASGDRVRISGVPDDRGGLRAARIEKSTDRTHELELKGWVSGLGAGGFTLKLSPDAGAASTYAVTLSSGVALPSGLANGSFVEVHSAAAVQAGNAILASGVTLEDGRIGDAGGETEVEGIVTSGTAAQFVVAGTTVTTSATTRWDGGLPADLAPGSKLEAEGLLGADGVLAARKVSFRANVRLFGKVAARAGSGADLTFQVNGVSVKGDAVTDWRTSGPALADGAFVEVRGQADRTGTGVVAARVEAKSGGNGRPFLQGVVSAFDPATGTVTILGKVIGSDGSTELRGHQDQSGVEGPVMLREAFFAALTAGVSVVKATGQKDADWTAGPSGAARGLEIDGER